MKRSTAILLTIGMILSLTACGSESSEGTPTESQPAVSTQEPANSPTENGSEDDTTISVDPADGDAPDAPSDTGGDAEQGSNILVAYFSRVGNTVWEDGVDVVTSASLNVVNGEFAGNAQLLAQMAQAVTGGDLFLIQTVDPYPSDYQETTDAASVEQRNNARPVLASHVGNMDQYDILVLIYPNWWGTLPQALYMFLEEYDFSGKTILPLCTHEGSRMGSSERAIAGLCPDATLLDGLDVRGASAASARSDVETWINSSGILG